MYYFNKISYYNAPFLLEVLKRHIRSHIRSFILLKVPVKQKLCILLFSFIMLLLLFSKTFGQTPYRFEIIAQTGTVIEGSGSIPGTDQIIDLGPGPSINDFGKVAFVVRDEPGIHGRIIVVNQKGIIERNFQVPPTERIGTDVQINNQDQIVWWRQIESPISLLNQDTLVQRLDTENSGEIIARGTITDWFDTIWDYTLPYVSMNNDGLVVFTGDLDPNKTSGGTVIATRNGGSGTYEMTNPIANFPVFFPMISDPMPSGDSRIAIRFGNYDNDPLLVITKNDMKTAHSVADTLDFNLIGKKPGISDDGSVVAFLAEGKDLGPGIYMGILNLAGDGGVTFKLADTPNIGSELSVRTGVNRTNGSAKDYTVVYMAKNSNEEMSLFRIRVDATDPYNHQVLEGPEALVTYGRPIDGLEDLGNVTNIGLYDPVNNYGQIVFWVETDTGSEAIVRAIEQIIYLDWINPVQMRCETRTLPGNNKKKGYFCENRPSEPLSNENLPDATQRSEILSELREIFNNRSGIQVKILEYNGPPKTDDALYVRFANQREDDDGNIATWNCKDGTSVGIPASKQRGGAHYVSFYGAIPDQFNEWIGGEIMIFLPRAGDGSNDWEKNVAETIAHEAGHGLGLRHIDPPPPSPPFPFDQTKVVMDYDHEVAEYEFTNLKSPLMEPPLKEWIREDGSICEVVQTVFLDEHQNWVYHNPVYHLKRYVSRISPTQLPAVSDVFQGPGIYDLKPFGKREVTFENINYNGALYDLGVIATGTLNSLDSPGDFATIASLGTIEQGNGISLSFLTRSDLSISIVASSIENGSWDLFFSSGDAPDQIITPEIIEQGSISGTIFKFSEITADFSAVGSFTVNVEDLGFVGPLEVVLDGDFEPDCDVDGADLAAYVLDDKGISIVDFAGNYGKMNCQ